MGERLSVLSESRVREIRLLGSMKRDVETESWNLDCGTANRKGRQQLRGTYHHRATSRLYESDFFFFGFFAVSAIRHRYSAATDRCGRHFSVSFKSCFGVGSARFRYST